MLQSLAEPLHYAFFQRSLLAALIVGVLCACTGSYLLVQRMALLGDAIGHSLLVGLAIAFAMGGSLFVGALVSGLVSAAAIDFIRARSPLKEDAAMGIVLSAFFALGIVLITLVQKDNKIDLNHFLFGNLLAVTGGDLWDTGLAALLVLGAIALCYKELHFYTFDRLGAQAAGLPVRWLDWGLTTAIAITIVASMKAVGVVLVLALLITPPATAYLLVPRLHQMMGLGALLGCFSSLTGLYLSYFFNLPSGPAIVLVASGLFVLALLFSPRQGLLIASGRSSVADASEGDRPAS
ncbi:MAG: metal ABC transporter permease [Oscillatoriales cyanobacterium]|nr:MAG: metal ABC transporter permease [Oscillatoriales cyanobacterium]